VDPPSWLLRRPQEGAEERGRLVRFDEREHLLELVHDEQQLACVTSEESDGGVALVVTTPERARDLRQRPAMITAAAQGAAEDGELMTSYYRDEITGLPEMAVVAKKLWSESGLTPGDIQTAFLYDHFTPFVLIQLEELGFCKRGEGKDFATIENLSLGGRLPINTSGGLLGEAYIHGMNGITEAVRQIRGTSCNQVENVGYVLVTSGTGVPTGGLILARS